MASAPAQALLFLIRRGLVVLAGGLVALSGVAQTPSWPTRTVTIIVPYSPGGGPDVLARALAERVTAATGKAVVVDNKTGANGAIGTDAATKAPPDGHTLVLLDRLSLAMNPQLNSKLPYRADDLRGVSDVATVKLLFVCRTDTPFKTWSEMLAYARERPGDLMVGTSGYANVLYLTLKRIEHHYRIKTTDVPYKGIAPAVGALLAGDVSCVVSGIEAVREHIRAGKLRGLAFAGDRRSPLLPDVPALTEVGAPADLFIATHFTLHAPAKTPTEVVRQINEQVARIQADPAFAERFGQRGLEISPSTPQALDQAVTEDSERLKTLIREANIKLQQ